MSEEEETLCPKSETDEEFAQLVKTLSEENARYCENKIKYDTLQEYLKDKILCPDLTEKVNSIIHQQEISQSNRISSQGNDWDLLGLNIPEPTLTYREQQDITNGLEMKFVEKTTKINSILKHTQKLNTNTSIKLPELTISDKVSIDLRTQLHEIQQKYLSNLIKKSDLLEEVLKLRMVSLPEVCNSKIDLAATRCKINDFKMKMVMEQMKVLVLAESSIALDAYKEVMKDVNVQMKEYESDIEELKLLLAKYQAVSCKEYDDILKSYLKYKTLIEQRKKVNTFVLKE